MVLRLLVIAALVAPAPVLARSDREIGGIPATRLICKRAVETGSIIRKRKQCFTRKQWDRIAEATHEQSRPNADTLDTRPGAEAANDMVFGIVRSREQRPHRQR